MADSRIRLQKAIAESGVTSRRKAEKLIVDGKVKVNGITVTTLGTKVSKNDEIEVNGIKLEKEEPVYFMFYKPREVISSVKDEKDRKVVLDFFSEVKERIFPIGRLDYQSSGLLLLTNDGEFANVVMHPRHGIEKVYIVKVKGIPHKRELFQMKKGVREGRDLLKALRWKVLSTDAKQKTAILEITLGEGKNRHIRRMMDVLGYPVLKIKREKYGLLTLDGLHPGEYRPLTPKEVKQMWSLGTKNVK
ncbi:MAG TPA: pseudouridine synthase [Cerasibacillus sp.]|uniref:pseudouridine synthase n=1 Tax=Cerasibacillus sp. TaxID=2498711 RepID=UPI002F42FB6D